MNFSIKSLLAVSMFVCAQGSVAAVLAPASVTAQDTPIPTIENNGIFVDALNFGGNAIVQDGVSFISAQTAVDATSTVFDNGSSGTTLSYTITPAATKTLRNSDLGDDLFQTEIFGRPANTNINMLIEGLDNTKTYRFQFLHGEPRTNQVYQDDVTFTDSDSNVATTTVNFGNGIGDYLIISVLVSGSTSLEYNMQTATTGRSGTFSGVAVHEVPEPSSLALIALGGLAMVRRRRAS